MTNIVYDKERRLNSLNQRLRGQLDGTAKKYFIGVPYLLTFKLYAITRSIEDANQIVEQIVPFVTPDYSLTLKIMPSVGIVDRMRMTLADNSPEWVDTYEKGFETTREIILTFTFTVQAMFYGPVAETPNAIIRKVIVDLYDARYDSNLTPPDYYITDSFDTLLLEDSSGRLIDESSITDLADIARIARIEVEPSPIDAPPIKPVDTTITVTEYEDGKVANVFTGVDSEIGA